MNSRYKIVLTLIVLLAVNKLLSQSINGPVSVCANQPYQYTVTYPSFCGGARWSCTNCSLSSTTGTQVSVTWSSAGQLSVTMLCREPDNGNTPVENGDAILVSITGENALANNKYFRTSEATSYYTTKETAPESSENTCTTTAEYSLVSYSDASGQGISPFVDFDNDVIVGMNGFPGHQQYDGGTATISMKWRTGWKGYVTIYVGYVTKKRAFLGNGHCSDDKRGAVGTYTFYRTDEAPQGTLIAPDEIVSAGAEVSFSVVYKPGDRLLAPPLVRMRYFLDNTLIKETEPCDPYTLSYRTSSIGTLTFNTQVKDQWGNWTVGPSKNVKIIPSCYQDNPSATISGITPEPEGGYKIEDHQNYTIQITGSTDFSKHYTIDYSDIGSYGTYQDNSFSITAPIGSFSINFKKGPNREACPDISSVQIFVGGKNLIIERVCPLTLPDDFEELHLELGFPPIDPNDIVLQYFAATIKSKRAIVVKPGLTLSLGAELILDADPPAPPPGEPDFNKNWIQSISYNDYGQVISENRNYFDEQGKILQSQSKNITGGVVLASQTIYDAYDRAVLSTLAAPVSSIKVTYDECSNQNVTTDNLHFAYKADFVKSTDGSDYNAAKFDIANGTVIEENPQVVSAATPGTLGWYYSANNGSAMGDQRFFNEELVPITSYPYSRTLFHRDGSGEVKGATRPGNVFRAGAGHVPNANTEKVLSTDQYLKDYLALYSKVLTAPASTDGQFFRTVSYDEEGRKAISYTDKGGNTIISLYFGPSSSPITTSYSIYDYAGRLIVSVSPNGVAAFKAGTDYSLIDKTTYKYNHKGWLLEMAEPDAGTTKYVYRKDGNIRFSQNAQQALDGKFSYTNYDEAGRAIESGECAGTFSFSNETLESTDPTGGFSGTRSDQVFTYYDRPVADLEADGLPHLDLAGRKQRFVHGAVSASHNANTTTAYSYDEQGRVEWMIQSTSIGTKTIDYRYGPTGAVQEVLYQKGNPDQFTHFYQYDADGRLSRAYTTTKQLQYSKLGAVINFGDLLLQATYTYYLHGPLKRVQYANNLQGIDYVYTADGALKSINDANPSNDPGKDGMNGVRADVFGMTLDYYSGDYLNSAYTPSTMSSSAPDHFTGLIKDTRWHSPVGNHKQEGYEYLYDERSQLQNAKWMTAIPKVTNPYLESIGGYDKNGNISSLSRKDESGKSIADFVYQYPTGKNRLDKIITSGSSPKDLRRYTYNAIGQMTEQEDVEAGKKQKVKYDVTGKVREVRDKDDQLITTYQYDDRGFRVNKTTYGSEPHTTWYIRDASGSIMATYEGTAPVEYPLYGSGRIGLYKPAYGNLYEITDHLGNVRAVIGKPEAKTFTATMEDKNPQQDEFVNYGNTRIPTIEGINHTPVDQSDATPKVTRLNGYYNIKEGPGKSLHVMPGDQVKVEVYAKYLDLRNNGGVNVSALLAFLLSGVGDFTSAYVDGVGYTITDTNTGQSIIFAGANNDSDIPQAWLNCLFFDEQKNPIEGKFVAQRVSEAAAITPFTIGAAHEKLSFEITIEKAGYLFINVTHDEQQNFDIYFDDLKITHICSDIVAGSDYYPFGLAITDRQITREDYRFGYQGQYSEKDEETGWNHFELREYDPVIGRWMATDPYGEYWSPFLGMGNNPVSAVDPDGGYSKFGAWWRNGFSMDGVYSSGGEWGFNKGTGNFVTETGYVNGKEFTFTREESVANFGTFGEGFGVDEILDRASQQYTQMLIWESGLPPVYFTGDGIEPAYPETWLMPSAPIKGTVLASKSLYAIKPTISQTKQALFKVHKILGGSLPKGKTGKFGSPQRGDSKKGYRLDPAHPERPIGHPESVPHINYWDYTLGKRGSGGISGAIPILNP